MAAAKDKKGGLLASISVGPDDESGGLLPDDEREESGELDMEQEAVDAAQEVLDALEAGDAKALDAALRAHYRACEEG